LHDQADTARDNQLGVLERIDAWVIEVGIGVTREADALHHPSRANVLGNRE